MNSNHGAWLPQNQTAKQNRWRTFDSLETIKVLGVDYAQGYAIAKPLPLANTELKKRRRRHG